MTGSCSESSLLPFAVTFSPENQRLTLLRHPTNPESYISQHSFLSLRPKIQNKSTRTFDFFKVFFYAIWTFLLLRLPRRRFVMMSILQTSRWRSVTFVFDFGLFVPLDGCCNPPPPKKKIWTNKKEDSKQMCRFLWSITDQLNTQKQKTLGEITDCVWLVCVDPTAPILLY